MTLRNLVRVLPVFIVATKAVSNAALSLYAIRAYDFGGAVASPVERNAAAASSLSHSEPDPEVSPAYYSMDANAMRADSAETTSLEVGPRLQKSTAAAAPAATLVEPTLAKNASLTYYKDKVGAAAVSGEHKPTSSPFYYRPIENEFLPVVRGTIDLEHLEMVGSEKGADGENGGSYDNAGLSSPPGVDVETKVRIVTSTRTPAMAQEYYYKPFHNSSGPSPGTQYEEAYHNKPFSISATARPGPSSSLKYEEKYPYTTTALTTTTTSMTPKQTLLQKIVDGEYNLFKDPVANLITFFTAAGILFQFFATPFGQVTTGRRRRKKKRVENTDDVQETAAQEWHQLKLSESVFSNPHTVIGVQAPIDSIQNHISQKEFMIHKNIELAQP